MSSSSPRSSALSRASRRSRDGVYDVTRRLEENILPVLLLAAVVAAVVITWVIGARYEAVAAAHGWAEFYRCGTLAGALLLAVLGVTAWVTAHAFMHSDYTSRLILLGIFVLVAVLLGVALWLFFNRSDKDVAFYLTVVVLVAALVHTYLCFRALHWWGVLGMVPAAVLVIYLLWRFWPFDDATVAATA